MFEIALLTSLVSNVNIGKVLDILRKELVGKKIIPVVPLAGGETADLKEQLGSMLKTANPTKGQYQSFVSAVSVNLSDLYENKRKRADQIFWFSIVCTAVAFVLLLLGLSLVFNNPNASGKGIIVSGTSIVPTFMSTTVFYLYRVESRNLKTLEKEIIKVKMMEGFLALSSGIQDKKVLQAAYNKIVEQMSVATV